MASKCFLRGEDSSEIYLADGVTYLKEFSVSKIDLKNKHLVVKTLPASRMFYNDYELESNSNIIIFEDDELAFCGTRYVVKFAGRKRSLESPVENVVNKVPKFDFINNDMQERHDGSWKQLGNNVLIYTTGDCIPSHFIASFGLDGTLIKTKSGKRLPRNEFDWCLFAKNTVTKIQKCIYKDDYKFVVFTNQFSLYNNVTKIEKFKQKIEKIAEKLNVPMQVFIAMAKDFNRKPCIGMWNLLQQRNGNEVVDMQKSFYVGGEVGGTLRFGKKYYFKANRLFAHNLELKFMTPDEFFLEKPPENFKMPVLNPAELKTIDYNVKKSDKQEVVLMVGAPCSGKSTFCKTHYTDYVIVNRDEQGGEAKCLEVLEDALRTGKSAVVDDANKNVASRENYIELAKRFKAPVRCFVLKTAKALCFHNRKFREIIDASHAKVRDSIIHSFFRDYEPPAVDEGIAEIVKINFGVQLQNPEVERLYRMYLLEK